MEVGDDLHLASAGNLVSFTFTVFAFSDSGGPYSAEIRFYEHLGSGGPGPLIASYTVPGIPNATIWTQTINLAASVPVPQDIWMSVKPLAAYGQALFDFTAPTIGSTTSLLWVPSFGGLANHGVYQHLTVRIGDAIGAVDMFAPQLAAPSRPSFETAPLEGLSTRGACAAIYSVHVGREKQNTRALRGTRCHPA
ncbi:MAG: hypothetical protein ACI9X4_001326 [Glaciecola sp.]|jgi:hypothetical protein